MVLEMFFESSIAYEIKTSQSSEINTDLRMTDADTWTVTLWTADAKSWLVGKDPITVEPRAREEEGMEMIWLDSLDWLNRHELDKPLK